MERVLGKQVRGIPDGQHCGLSGCRNRRSDQGRAWGLHQTQRRHGGAGRIHSVIKGERHQLVQSPVPERFLAGAPSLPQRRFGQEHILCRSRSQRRGRNADTQQLQKVQCQLEDDPQACGLGPHRHRNGGRKAGIQDAIFKRGSVQLRLLLQSVREGVQR